MVVLILHLEHSGGGVDWKGMRVTRLL